jgi:hypothetical protein
VVAEELNPEPDQPVGERRVAAAGQLVDPARLGTQGVEAAVLRVEDLVEDEADRSRQAGKAQDRGTRGDGSQGRPVDP